MAYWHNKDGKIWNGEGICELVPGIIQYFLIHTLIDGDECKVHLFAKVFWLKSLPSVYRYHWKTS